MHILSKFAEQNLSWDFMSPLEETPLYKEGKHLEDKG